MQLYTNSHFLIQTGSVVYLKLIQSDGLKQTNTKNRIVPWCITTSLCASIKGILPVSAMDTQWPSISP